MPSSTREAARGASIFTTPPTRSFSAICRSHGPFHAKLQKQARPPQPSDPDALKNRSTPEVTSPIWRVPPFSFAGVELPLGSKFKASPSYERGKIPTFFHNFYVPAYKLGFVGNEILMNSDHPLHIRMRRKYDATEKGCLWWSATMFVKTSPKRFIRDEMNRRLRAAFRAALAERGLDERARKVLNGKAESLGAIRGTFSLVGKPEMFRATPEDLKKEAQWAVDALLRMFGYQRNKVEHGRGHANRAPAKSQINKPRQDRRRNP